VWATSGWNCSPNTGRVRCFTAASGQVAVDASGTKSGPASVTWSPWLIHTVDSAGYARNRAFGSPTVRVARPYSRVWAAPPTAPPRARHANCIP
jgi:hypothetical protein